MANECFGRFSRWRGQPYESPLPGIDLPGSAFAESKFRFLIIKNVDSPRTDHRLGKRPIEVVERALDQERIELVLIVARAIGLSWPTLKAILLLRCGPNGLPSAVLDQALPHFERLKPTTAQPGDPVYLLRNGKAEQRRLRCGRWPPVRKINCSFATGVDW
jgi:hypothetical protein